MIHHKRRFRRALQTDFQNYLQFRARFIPVAGWYLSRVLVFGVFFCPIASMCQDFQLAHALNSKCGVNRSLAFKRQREKLEAIN